MRYLMIPISLFTLFNIGTCEAQAEKVLFQDGPLAVVEKGPGLVVTVLDSGTRYISDRANQRLLVVQPDGSFESFDCKTGRIEIGKSAPFSGTKLNDVAAHRSQCISWKSHE